MEIKRFQSTSAVASYSKDDDQIYQVIRKKEDKSIHFFVILIQIFIIKNLKVSKIECKYSTYVIQ